MAWDRALFLWLNGLAGHVAPIDRLFSGLADDYFMVISMCLVLVAMWFGTRDPLKRAVNQVAVLLAMASMGIATGLVSLCNVLFVRQQLMAGSWLNALFNRPRPFAAGLPVHLLFYQPTDPSFPSNLAAVVFGLALGVWLMNKRAGSWLFLMAIAACFARVYVGIHYPFDIVGGFLLAVIGTGLAYFFFWLLSPFKRLLFSLLKALYLAG